MVCVFALSAVDLSSSSGQVKQKTIILVLAAFPLGTQQ